MREWECPAPRRVHHPAPPGSAMLARDLTSVQISGSGWRESARRLLLAFLRPLFLQGLCRLLLRLFLLVQAFGHHMHSQGRCDRRQHAITRATCGEARRRRCRLRIRKRLYRDGSITLRFTAAHSRPRHRHRARSGPTRARHARPPRCADSARPASAFPTRAPPHPGTPLPVPSPGLATAHPAA